MSAPDRRSDSQPWPFKKEPEPENFNNPWTPEEESELLKLRAEGVSFPRIAALLERSTRAVRSRMHLIRRTERGGGGTDPSPGFKPATYPPGEDPLSALADHNIETDLPVPAGKAGEDRPMTLGELHDRLPADLPRGLPVRLAGPGDLKAIEVAYVHEPDGPSCEPREVRLIGPPEEGDEEADA